MTHNFAALRSVAARADADAAKAIVSGASAYAQNVVWQGVYNLSMLGCWEDVDHIILPRVGTTDKGKDLKGGSDAATYVGAGGSYSAQDGWSTSSTGYIKLPWDLQATANDRNYAIGGYFSAIAGGSARFIFGGSTSGASASSVGLMHNSGSTRMQAYLSSTWATVNTSYSSLSEFLSTPIAISAQTGNTTITTYYNGTSSAGSDIASVAIRPNSDLAIGGSLNNGTTLNGPCAVTCGAFYVTDSAINMPVFLSEIDAMMNALAMTTVPFGNAYANGDSLMLGAKGLVAKITDWGNVDDQSTSGKTLEDISSESVIDIAAYTACDGIVFEGGVNQFLPANWPTTAAEMKGWLDDAIAAKDDAGVPYMLVMGVMPFRGNPAFAWTTEKQAVLDEYNLYLQGIINSRADILGEPLALYDWMESDAVGQEDASESGPTVVSGGTKQPRVEEGVHWSHFGSDSVAARISRMIRRTQYYKG